MKQSFGGWLRHELARRHMRQADLARRMQASTGAVSDWVNDRTLPSPASVDRIADVLMVDVDEALAIAGHRPVRYRDDLEQFRAELEPYLVKLDQVGRDTVLRVARSMAPDDVPTSIRSDAGSAPLGAGENGTLPRARSESW